MKHETTKRESTKKRSYRSLVRAECCLLPWRALKIPLLLTADTIAVHCLLNYAWPRNVRELEHAITAAASMSDGDIIRGKDLSLESGPERSDEFELTELLQLPLTEAKNRLVESFERHAIERALEKNEGNVSAAARQLGIHRQSLQQKMQQLGIG